VSIDIRRAAAGEEERVLAAEMLFDDPVDLNATRRFLADDANVLLIAYVDDVPGGFVTGTELTHPDKSAPELFLNELGVDEGIAAAASAERWWQHCGASRMRAAAVACGCSPTTTTPPQTRSMPLRARSASARK
jgi:hypothetical protein